MADQPEPKGLTEERLKWMRALIGTVSPEVVLGESTTKEPEPPGLVNYGMDSDE